MAGAINQINTQQPTPNLWDKAATTVDGVQRITAYASKVIGVVGAFLAQIPEQLSNFSLALKGCRDVLGLFDFVGSIKYWITDYSAKTTSNLKLISKIFSTVLSTSSFFYFLQTIKAADFDSLCGKIGSIPIFSLTVNSLGLVSSGISLATDSIELKQTISKVKQIEKNVRALREQEKMLADSDPQKADLKDRVIVLEKVASEAKFERTKAWLAVVGDIIKIAVAILGLVGLCAGITALTSGLPMLFIGLAVATYGMAKFIYEETHTKAI